MKKIILLGLFVVSSFTLLQAVYIKNSTEYSITMRPVTAKGARSYDPFTLEPDQQKEVGVAASRYAGTHIDVDFAWSPNEIWVSTMKNKDKTTRDWGFSYVDLKQGNTYEFKMNADYNAPVLYNSTRQIWMPQRK